VSEHVARSVVSEQRGAGRQEGQEGQEGQEEQGQEEQGQRGGQEEQGRWEDEQQGRQEQSMVSTPSKPHGRAVVASASLALELQKWGQSATPTVPPQPLQPFLGQYQYSPPSRMGTLSVR
jgi:hypothetical protein